MYITGNFDGAKACPDTIIVEWSSDVERGVVGATGRGPLDSVLENDTGYSLTRYGRSLRLLPVSVACFLRSCGRFDGHLLRIIAVETLAVSMHGFVYSANFGDMLLCRLARDMVRRHAPEARVSLPFATQKFLRSADISSTTGLGSFLQSDALLYQGGGYFSFSPLFHLRNQARLYRRFYAPALAAACLRKPYAVFGVGVGPLPGSLHRQAVRRLFDEAVMVSVRDEEGYDWARKIGVTNENVHLTADLALNLTWKDVPSEAVAEADRILDGVPAEYRIGLHLSAPSNASAAYDAIMRGVVEYVERHPSLGIVVLCDHVTDGAQDRTPQYQAALELKSRIGERAKFVGQPSLWTLVALLGKLDGLVTNKLHAGIVSSAFGKRVVSIAKNDKNFRFFRQIDAPSRCMSVRDAASADIAGFLESGFESLQVATPLPQSLRDLAGKNETLIGAFLKNVANGRSR